MNAKIGKKICTLRESKGLSQEDMAERLHVSQSVYSRMENGETNNWVNLIEKLCNELDIKPEDLFSTDGLVQNNSDNASAVQNHTQHDTHITINHLSDRIIELYEEKFNQMKEEIQRLKEEIEKLK